MIKKKEWVGKFSVVVYDNDHEPAHVHVIHAEIEYRLVIADGSILTKEGRMKAKELKEVRAWIKKHRTDLLDLWVRRTK